MSGLRIELANFRGPLDLLLHLVQQEEVAIEDLPLARISDQFLTLVREQVHDLDVDKAGEYLVMASQLMVLKSRALLPREDELDLEEIDPRLDLVRQLLEYRDFRVRAEELGGRASEQALRHGVRVAGGRASRPTAEDPLEVDLYLLVAAFQRLLRETGEDEAVAMPKERLPITHFVGEIFDRLTQAGGRMSFRELIGGRRERSYVIGAFLALLELMKLHKVRVLQEGQAEIEVDIAPEAVGIEAGEATAEVADSLDMPELDEESGGPRIVFMGTPEIAVPALRSLVGAGLRPRLVVTPPPRRSGRGRRAQQVPVAKEADSLELPLHRTGDANGRASRSEIEAVQPDVIVTMGFGQKLGSGLLGLPEKGCLNVHVSLLPAYRGASPIPAVIRDRCKETGVTIFRMTAGLDEGPILAAARHPLRGDETADGLSEALGELGADLLVRTLPAWLEGEIEPRPQDDEQANYVGRIEKEDGIVDFSQPVEAVEAHVRSVTSWPGAQTAWQPQVRHEPLPLLLARCEIAESSEVRPSSEDGPRPGQVLEAAKTGIVVACGSGSLRVLRVRPSGAREMDVRDFLNSRRVVAGDRFVAPRERARA